jgi:hypothetical protein
MSDDPKTRAAFDEMRAQAQRLRRSQNADTLNLLSLITALMDHLDPQSAPPPRPSEAEVNAAAAAAVRLANWDPRHTNP